MTKKARITAILPLILFPAAALLSFLYLHVLIDAYTDLTYSLIYGAMILLAVAMGLLCAKARGGKKGKVAVSAIISGIVCAAALFMSIYGLGNILRKPTELNGVVAMGLYAVQILVTFILCKPPVKRIISAVSILLSLALFFTSGLTMAALPVFYKTYYKTVASPAGFGTYSKREVLTVTNADFYVSTAGNDENDGSHTAPFATIEKARDAVRALEKTGKSGITVAVMAGEYRTNGIEFTAEDSGTAECPVTYCAYGDGEVILNGGVTLKSDSFRLVEDEGVRNRFADDAADKILCTDLTKLGLTADDWGKIYAIGSYNTAAKYGDDRVGGIYSELFFNDTRMILARYPNNGEFLKTTEVVSTGYGKETNGSLTVQEDWNSVHNPLSDVYKLEKELSDRVASWATLDDVWMFGFWKYTWADSSSPVGGFDAAAQTISPEFVSLYGTTTDAPYYFFNVLEELDAPGEWYLDRENGIIYMYPLADMSDAEIDMSLTTENIIKVTDADYLTFEGFTVKGTRGNAMEMTGNNLTVRSCLIKNIGENALLMTGYNNLAGENEITHTGKGGIILDGGDSETLTAGNSKADNNLIHDWSEIYQTYQPAVTLNGVGNICSHNEIYNSPHEAITYSGNNHIIEYNNIHDVCLLSDDAGAIYSGRHWYWYGTIVRYNAVYNLGSSEHKPNGIYFDDALSGQTAYGNILINIPRYGILVGGGRDNNIYNNIIINSGMESINYDERARDGVINNGWFTHSSKKDGEMWQELFESPWQTETWQKAFPAMTRFSDDFNDTDNPDFVPNPAYSTVRSNLLVNLKGEIGDIAESVYRFSTVEGNAIYKLSKLGDIFTNPDSGDYTIKSDSTVYESLPELINIPFSEIGRY